MRSLIFALALAAILLAPPARAASQSLPYSAAPSVTRPVGACLVPVDGNAACFSTGGARSVDIIVADLSGNAVAFDVEFYDAQSVQHGVLSFCEQALALPTNGAAHIVVHVRAGTGVCFQGGFASAGTVTATFS